jgi:hypothetical protein
MPETKAEIADQLFHLANALGGDETGHLAAVIHCVVSELSHGADAFVMIHELEVKLALIKKITRSNNARVQQQSSE